MIQEDEYIIFVSQAKVAITIKEEQSMKTGMNEKKIVITTRRCLFFESLSNVAQIQYNIIQKKQNKKKKEEQQQKKRLSVNQFPQYFFGVEERDSKIIIEEEKSCFNYLKKMGIANLVHAVTGIVLLKNIQKHKFELISFSSLRQGFRFCKALMCARAWKKYEKYCEEQHIKTNRFWIRILIELLSNERSAVVIDPDLFLDGSRLEIQSFFVLMEDITFAHSFQHRYAIINSEAAQYAQEFIEVFQQTVTALILSNTRLESNYFSAIFPHRLQFKSLIFLDLSSNNISDQIFIPLQHLLKSCSFLSKINLEKNKIVLREIHNFIALLKIAHVRMSINLKSNQLIDPCIENVEKFILFSSNPPLQELNFSMNKFSRKGAWRLFLGHQKNLKYHPYFNFIIYPIPFKPEIFPLNAIDYPKQSEENNYNLHSALMQQFDQQSMMKHTLHDILPSSNSTIRFVRFLPDNKKLPQTKQQIRKTLELSNKIQNFIYAPQHVQSIYQLGVEIAQTDLNIPPTTLARFRNYISDKLNEALFIRDHYAVKYILKIFIKLSIVYDAYEKRLDKLKLRDEKILEIIENIMNLEINQTQINKELDGIVKEGLRLYLQGQGIEVIYYLKFLRDRWIQKLLYQQYNPQHYIYEKMAEKNMNMDETVTEKDLMIPYEIRVEKRINENFYLHPWSTNYIALSQLSKAVYEECQKFLVQSTKRQKFALYFDRIEERIEFMKNQFFLFSYSKFKYSYSDLKANCARLLSMYKHLQEKNIYLEMPSWSRKKRITPEKRVKVDRPDNFVREYHISKYPNINQKARLSGFYNFKQKITKYNIIQFQPEFKKIQKPMNRIFQIFSKESLVKGKHIPEEIMPHFRELVKIIRQNPYPVQLKQEFYLHILSWRNGRHMNNTEMLDYIPFFTMYLRPPLALQKYLIAGLYENKQISPMIPNMSFCLVSDVNKVTEANIKQQEEKFIERDWMGSDQNLANLMHRKGMVTIKVQLLTKQAIQLSVPESKTIGEIVELLIPFNQDRLQDFEHFWLYFCQMGTENFHTLDESEHIGELLVAHEDQDFVLLFKRRVYCMEWKYIYKKYSSSIVNSLFYDFKYQYLLGQFFVNDKNAEDIVSYLMIIDVIEDPKRKLKPDQALEQFLKNTLKKKYSAYISGKTMNRLMKNKEQLLDSLRQKIKQKLFKKEHVSIGDLKIKVLKYFEEYPEFLSSNYIFSDRNGKKTKVSINSLFIHIESGPEDTKIMMEKIISAVPKLRYLSICYHSHQGILKQINLESTQNVLISAALDIVACCTLRIKMASSALYDIHKYEVLMDQHFRESKTKDKAIIFQKNTLRKRLQRIAPTILLLKQFEYTHHNKYIKGRSARKLYVNATHETLQMQNEIVNKQQGEFYSKYEKQSHYNIFTNIFPSKEKPELQMELQRNNRDEEEEIINPKNVKIKQEYENIPDYVPDDEVMMPNQDYYKERNKRQEEMNMMNTTKKEKQEQYNNPYQSPDKKDKGNDDQEQVVTMVKPSGQRRIPPRKNR